MSFYSGGEVKSKFIDPVNYIPNVRAEFRLDHIPVFLSNIRLANLGVVGNAGGNNIYNKLVGSYGLIKNIRLMDGQTELSSLRNANRYLGFKQLLLSNSKNESVNKYLNNNDVGYFVDQTNLNVGAVRDTNFNTINTADSTTNKGHIDLRGVLPLLNSLRSLNNQLFPKLKIVLEFEDVPQKFLNVNNVNTTTLRPVLIVDEVVDEGVMNNEMKNFPNSITWLEVEHDTIQIPTITGLSGANVQQKQTVSSKVRGFDNKNLQRLVVLKNNLDEAKYITANVNQDCGNMGSQAQYKEKINYVVNGANVLSGSGLDTPASRLAMTCETWGDLNLVPSENNTSLVATNNIKDVNNRIGKIMMEFILDKILKILK